MNILKTHCCGLAPVQPSVATCPAETWAMHAGFDRLPDYAGSGPTLRVDWTVLLSCPTPPASSRDEGDVGETVTVTVVCARARGPTRRVCVCECTRVRVTSLSLDTRYRRSSSRATAKYGI